MVVEEIKNMKTFNFHCSKCQYDFSIDLEESDSKDFLSSPKQKKVFCVKCGKVAKLIGQENGISKGKKRHINEEASIFAMEQVNKQKRIDAESGIDEEVSVTSTQKGKGYGKTEMIPKKVIEKIDEKVKPFLE